MSYHSIYELLFCQEHKNSVTVHRLLYECRCAPSDLHLEGCAKRPLPLWGRARVGLTEQQATSALSLTLSQRERGR
jgi:hypothetical protein